MVRADEIAMKAAHLVSGDRQKTHGEKRANFENIARLWNAWLVNKDGPRGHLLTASDVAELMVLLKIARMSSGEYNPDDALDACGYAAIAGELAEPVVTRR